MDAPEESIEIAENDTGPGKKIWIVIIAVVIVTIIAIWLVPSSDEPAAPEDIPLPGQNSNPVQSDQTPRVNARAFIQNLQGNDGTPDDAYAEAVRQQTDGKLEDAYLLYFYAARKGHAEASLALGEQADPAHFSANRSLLEAPDAEQAYKWYTQAVAAGSPAANNRLAALINFVEARASAGDEQAQRLMLQWK